MVSRKTAQARRTRYAFIPPPIDVQPKPWREPRWLVDRLAETLYTSLGVVPLMAWITLIALVYVAIMTSRPTTDLQIAVLGLAGIYAGRRVGDRYVDTKFGAGNGEPPAGDNAPQKPKKNEPVLKEADKNTLKEGGERTHDNTPQGEEWDQ